jgi:Lipopolysaccharide export system permease LptF/LptG
VIRDARDQQELARKERAELVENDLRTLLVLPPALPAPPPAPSTRNRGYCGWFETIQTLVLPKTVEAQSSAQGLTSQRPQAPRARVRLSSWSEVATAADRVREADRRAARYAVEVHKKWAISMACVSFVIIGIVLALRFPRAGIGLVIGGGLAVFSIHYVGLTAGESLADRGHLSPWIAMWTPNIVLTLLGVFGLVRVSRESGSTRGGDFQEIIDGIRHLLRRLRGAAPP